MTAPAAILIMSGAAAADRCTAAPSVVAPGGVAAGPAGSASESAT
jgi:hypothetical protein